MKDYVLLKEIGHGTFGRVFLSMKKGDENQKYAVKQIEKSLALKPQYKKYLDNELNILKETEHPNIIKLIAVEQTVKYFFIVTELCDDGLSSCLEKYLKKNRRPFTQSEAQHLIRQICAGIKYLHQNQIGHR